MSTINKKKYENENLKNKLNEINSNCEENRINYNLLIKDNYDDYEGNVNVKKDHNYLETTRQGTTVCETKRNSIDIDVDTDIDTAKDDPNLEGTTTKNENLEVNAIIEERNKFYNKNSSSSSSIEVGIICQKVDNKKGESVFMKDKN